MSENWERHTAADGLAACADENARLTAEIATLRAELAALRADYDDNEDYVRRNVELRSELAARDKEISRLTVELAECKLYKLLPSVDEPGTVTVCHSYITADTPGYDPRTDDLGNQRHRYGRGV